MCQTSPPRLIAAHRLRDRLDRGVSRVHFAEWKQMGGGAGRQLEVMLDGVFAPARLLELIRDFVLFETDGARTSVR